MVNYIPEPIRKTVGGFKDKVVSLFKTNKPENYSKQTVMHRKKQSEEDNIIKNVRNLFKLKKEIETSKHRIIRDNRNLFEKEDDYYKPIRVGNIWENNYIEYASNSDINKNLSVKEYLNKSKPYLKDIIDLQKSGTWTI